MIFGNVAKAKQLLGSGGSGSTGGGGNPSAPQAPSFNLVQGTGTNQIAQSLQKQAPIKTYVVAKDVTSGQSFDRNIIESASL
jgi:cell division protein YceG involved in septum cleavage